MGPICCYLLFSPFCIEYDWTWACPTLVISEDREQVDQVSKVLISAQCRKLRNVGENFEAEKWITGSHPQRRRVRKKRRRRRRGDIKTFSGRESTTRREGAVLSSLLFFSSDLRFRQSLNYYPLFCPAPSEDVLDRNRLSSFWFSFLLKAEKRLEDFPFFLGVLVDVSSRVYLFHCYEKCARALIVKCPELLVPFDMS